MKTTLEEARTKLSELKSWIDDNGYGHNSQVQLNLLAGAGTRDSTVELFIYLDRKCNDCELASAPDLDAAVEKMKVKIVAKCSSRDEEATEKMALAIIRIRHTKGEVTDRDLSMEFSESQLKSLLAAAVTRACDMAADAPFEVKMVRDEKNASVDLEQEVPF